MDKKTSHANDGSGWESIPPHTFGATKIMPEEAAVAIAEARRRMAPIRQMLRQHRAIHNIEQINLAAIIGVSASTLCRFEKGKSMEAEATLRLINWLFGVQP